MSQPSIYREQPARSSGPLRAVTKRQVITFAATDVPTETRSVPAETRNVPAETRNVPAETRNVPTETRDIAAEAREQRFAQSTSPGAFSPALTAAGSSNRVPAGTFWENALIEILDSASLAGETIELSFRRKEAQLRSQFAALSVFDARTLHGRLANPRPDDAVAVRFSRLVADRRARLLTFLADARRRAAIAAGRR
ncbi:MAG: hypothetical protein JWO36_6563 [Myxococcales bacterium]|nr:hypothetical protein [Myxococcales bacterium]